MVSGNGLQIEQGKTFAWRNALRPTGSAGPEMVLARAGKTDYTLVLPARPTTQEKKAAADLAQWLGEMTGAAFPVMQEGATGLPSAKIVGIGRTALLQKAELSEADRDLGNEGYAILMKDQNLYLLGGQRRGPINAVYALLEEDLGCRWYTINHQVIPHTPDLKCQPVPRSFLPVLELRDPYYYDALNGIWALRNRVNAPHSGIPPEWGGHINYANGYFVHTYNSLVPPDRYFKDHPEYFSELNGSRQPVQLCLTNPDVLQIVIAQVREVLRANPQADLISVSPNDGTGYCTCAGCLAIDQANGGGTDVLNGACAGSLITFVNQVAAAVEKEFPGVKVSTLAYLGTLDPPRKVRPRSNVVIQFCNDLHSWRWPLTDFVSSERPLSKRYRDALVAWSKITGNIHVWDYFVNFDHYLGPMPNMHVLAPSVRFYLHHHIQGIMFQAAYQGPGGERALMRSWVMAKYLWDPSRSVEALERDFVEGYYQQAAPPILAYYNLIDASGRQYKDAVDEEMGGIRFPMDAPFLTKRFLVQASELFEKAERLAKDDPELLARVKLEKLPITYAKLHRGPGFTGDNYTALVDEFEAVTRKEGVTHLKEGPPAVAPRIKLWREMAKTETIPMACHSLSNAWRFKTDPANAGVAEKWYAPGFNDASWVTIRSDLDRGWVRQGFKGYAGHGWYRQELEIPPGFDARKFLWLLFTGVDADTEIFVNGRKAMERTMTGTGLSVREVYTAAIQLDLRPFLNHGGDNRVAVRVSSTVDIGGIWRPVYLVSSESEADPDALAETIRLKEKQQ